MSMSFYRNPMSGAVPTISTRVNTRPMMFPPSTSPTPINSSQPNGMLKTAQGTNPNVTQPLQPNPPPNPSVVQTPSQSVWGANPPAQPISGPASPSPTPPSMNMPFSLPPTPQASSGSSSMSPSAYQAAVQQYGTPPAGVDPGMWFYQQSQGAGSLNTGIIAPHMIGGSNVSGPIQPSPAMASNIKV